MAIDPFTAASLGVQGLGLISSIGAGVGGQRRRRRRLQGQARGDDPMIDAMRRSAAGSAARIANQSALASGANPAAALRQASQSSVQMAQNNEDRIAPLQQQRMVDAQTELDTLRQDQVRRGLGAVSMEPRMS